MISFDRSNQTVLDCTDSSKNLTLGGEQSVVAKDMERVAEIVQAMGLTLNISKCELIIVSGTGQLFLPCPTVIQEVPSVISNSTLCSLT